MKGIVFNEFMDFVESVQGIVAVDEMISVAKPPSGGAYTAAGYYDFHEMFALVQALSARCGVAVPDLVRAFGQHLFGRLIAQRSELLRSMPDVYTFLESIEGQIHVEVRRIYPDADLPMLETERSSDGSLLLRYRSRRHLADLALGMIEGCIAHYGGKATVTRRDLADEGELQVTEFKVCAL
ncbi:heme NO-binding domain-containing protein [Iodobacter sp. CM08]|uniref:heme NO-binding domain-containing protein n=1 Tax=Iodobacter sp. CM08 TaxID=3085902 RepID=UPI002982654E|nr:heme NO-binding domain-containing protein [Iodobacter sp. CM08]MDW5417676.1 heme NO-binding domain-containing protein [Iodobacter sp. CM08]